MANHARGEQSPRATATEAQVRHFKTLLADGYSTRAAAAEAGLTFDQGKNIRSGKSWKHVTVLHDPD